jgi:hypothetical protein
MKRLLLGLVFLGPAIVSAQSAFDGVWRTNLESTDFVGKETYNLQDGLFRCSTCDPKVETRADGKDHALAGSPYYDTVNVRVVDDRTVEVVNKKAGKVAATVKLSASTDGKSLATEFVNVNKSGQQVSGKYMAIRLEPAPATAHRISGVWKPGKLDGLSENAMEITYKTTDDSLSMSDNAGNSYTAKLDGKDYPYKGDAGITAIAVRKIDARTIEETYKRNGKTVGVSRLTVAPDGKTLSASYQDKLRDIAVKWTADKR